MVEVGNIVTLENNNEYLILEELNYEGSKYYYAVRTVDDETPTDEYLIFELLKQNEEEYLLVVEDKKLYDVLIEEFKNKVVDKFIKSEESKQENEEEF